MTEAKRQSLQPISRSLLSAYNILIENGQVFFPVEDEHADKIDIIVKTVQSNYFGFTVFPTPKERAAAYFYLIIKDHPMTDGNKRLAVLWLDIYAHALDLNINQKLKLDEIAVAVEQDKSTEMHRMIRILEAVFFH